MTLMAADERGTVSTRASLVAGMQAGVEDRWAEFCQVYGPVIRGFALKAGLTETEADEVAQETSIAVARHVREFRYDPKACRFKTWLLNQAGWRVKDALRKRRRWDDRVHRSGPEPGEGSDHGQTATIERVSNSGAEELEKLWDQEWEGGLFRRALETLRPKLSAKQFQVFDLYVRKEWPVSEVALALGMSVPAVYLMKHRVAAALKREIAIQKKRWD